MFFSLYSYEYFLFFMKKLILLFSCILLTFIIHEGIWIYLSLGRNTTDIGSTRIFDRNGALLTEIWWKNGYARPYTGSLDTPLIRSIIQIEDKRFWDHHGVDVWAKFSSLYENYQAGKIVRWGSTLTEQYIKNAYFPNAERTLTQKVREAYWASIMEIRFSKEEILKKYLDTIYMGNNIYGISGALEWYFQKSIDTLHSEEIVEIITRIHSPNLGKWSKEYSKKIGKLLYGENQERDIDVRERFRSTDIFPMLTSRIRGEVKKYCNGRKNTLSEFTKNIPPDTCSTSFLSLYTSIDMGLMQFSEDTLEGILTPLEAKNVTNGAVYIYSPDTWKILAYIGNRKKITESNAIDMINERRSVGSVLKPFVYLLALEDGADEESLILDDTKVYHTEDADKKFLPENYIPKSYWPIPLREALWNSLNSATVRLSESVGIGKIYEAYKKAGMDLDHDSGYYGYGISLWGVELSLENVVYAYTSLTDTRDPAKFILYTILSDAKNRARTFWISSILNTSIPLAVKTGTSTDFHDNWAIWYNSDAIIWVWVGNADNSEMDDVSWVSGAWPIYHHIAEYMIAKGMIRNPEKTIPLGIKESSICLDTLCNQKILSYTRDGFMIKSRPKSNLYFESDFITPLTNEEKKKWKIE